MKANNSKFLLDENDLVETPKEEVKYCKKCRTKNSKNAKFCFECGNNTFVNSLDDVSNILDMEVDPKYEKELNEILKKIEKRNQEIKELRKKNSLIEDEIAKNEKNWQKKIDEKLANEQVVIDKNNKVIEQIEKYKKQLEDTKLKNKELDKKIKDANKRKKLFEEKLLKAKEEKKELASGISTLSLEKKELERRIAKQEETARKLKEDAERRAKEAEQRAKAEAERKAREAAAKKAAEEEEIRRQNSPEVKFASAVESYRKGYYSSGFSDALKAANAGYAKSYAAVGIGYEYGLGTTANYATAKMWYQKAAAAGDPIGSFKLLNMGKTNYTGASESLLYEMAKYYDVGALLTLGNKAASTASFGLSSNALNWYDKAASAGSAEGAFYAAQVREKCSTQGEAAFKYYEMAAERGYKPAMLKLSELYKSGHPFFWVNKDAEKSKYWKQKYNSRY